MVSQRSPARGRPVHHVSLDLSTDGAGEADDGLGVGGHGGAGGFGFAVMRPSSSRVDGAPRSAVRQLLSPIRSERHYRTVERFVEALLAIVGEDERHPLASLLDLLTLHMEAYEEEHHRIEGKSGPEVLEFLMDQHGLNQADLAKEFGGQGNVSDVLAGKRELNVRQIRALSKRFRVSPAVFFNDDKT